VGQFSVTNPGQFSATFNTPFRTVLPATHIDRIRAERDNAWKWTV